jgi:hypothetical protein
VERRHDLTFPPAVAAPGVRQRERVAEGLGSKLTGTVSQPACAIGVGWRVGTGQ